MCVFHFFLFLSLVCVYMCAYVRVCVSVKCICILVDKKCGRERLGEVMDGVKYLSTRFHKRSCFLS